MVHIKRVCAIAKLLLRCCKAQEGDEAAVDEGKLVRRHEGAGPHGVVPGGNELIDGAELRCHGASLSALPSDLASDLADDFVDERDARPVWDPTGAPSAVTSTPREMRLLLARGATTSVMGAWSSGAAAALVVALVADFVVVVVVFDLFDAG